MEKGIIPGGDFHKFPPKEEIGRIWPPWVPLWMQTILITSPPSLTTIHRILTPLGHRGSKRFIGPVFFASILRHSRSS